MPQILRWTGHPLADVGVATLCAMTGKHDPDELTIDDLDAVGKELQSAYTDSIFVSYLSCVYTMNAPYTNPTTGKVAREASIRRLLFPHRSEFDAGVSDHYCVFSGAPATHFMERSQMPMLTGAGVMNFFPAGLSELPVAAPYLLAIQALALGGRRSEGKLMIVHCDDPQFTLQFVRRYLAKNRLIINLSQANRLPSIDDPDNLLDRELPGGLNSGKRPKYPDAKAPESLMMADLMEVVTDRKSGKLKNSYTSVTVYLMSNSGQGPSLDIKSIPCQFVEFLFELQSSIVGPTWQQLVHRSWRIGKDAESDKTTDDPGKAKPKKIVQKSVPSGAGRSRNGLYNELFAVFEHGYCDRVAAARFIRRHLLSDATKFYFEPAKFAHTAPRVAYEQLEYVNWELTSLFLRRVIGMDTERIELIKKFGTSLADLIYDHRDRRLFRDLVFTSGEWQYRAILTKVQIQYAKDRGKLALGFDEYVAIFLTTEPGERHVWSLVRDLISIGIVERLFERGFFDSQENREALTAPETHDE